MLRAHFLLKALMIALPLCFPALAAGGAEAKGSPNQHAPGPRRWPLTVASTEATGFVTLPPETTGLRFTNQLSAEAAALNQNLLNGSGVALGDADADGWVDIFLCSLNGRCALYRNLGGWQFEDVSDASGLQLVNAEARGAVWADIDGDTDLDLLVSLSGRGVRLFTNNGQGRFVEQSQAGLSARTGSTSLALGDVDGDGDLDLYVANYGENTVRSGIPIATRMVGGREVVVGRYRNRLKIIQGQLVEYGEPDVLYLNEGQGQFTAVPWTEGRFRDEQNQPLLEPPWELGLAVALRDINQDGNPDLYVCNDFQNPDRLWLGDGQGGFRLIAREALRATCHFSMSVDFADVNRDGYDDFVVTDMVSRTHELRMTQMNRNTPPRAHTFEPDDNRPQYRRNMLFLNRGDGSYAEIGLYAGVAASDWSWSSVFIDVDLDGWDDLLVGNGHDHDAQDLDAIESSRQMTPGAKRDRQAVLDLYPALRTPNVAFRNQRDLTFLEYGSSWGFNALDVSHSLARGDLDNDGDDDIAVNCLRSAAKLYRNDSSNPRLVVRLKGTPPNTAGIGARLRLSGGSLPAQECEMTAGGHYLAGEPPQRVFACGAVKERLTLQITWRSGRKSLIHNLQPNYGYEIDEALTAQRVDLRPQPPAHAPWFKDQSSILAYRDPGVASNDWLIQPSLPWSLSSVGPAVAWFDIDGDHDEDLIVGHPPGGSPVLFQNAAGQLTQVHQAFGEPLQHAAGGIIACNPAPGETLVLTATAQANPSKEAQPAASIWRRENDTLHRHEVAALMRSSAGPLALGDVDGDGDLDLFIGGRWRPGRYPEAAESLILRYNAGQFNVDQESTSRLQNLGLVTAAVFSDLQGDGQCELLVACEWDTIKAFDFSAGYPREVTPSLGLPRLTGLWTSIATGDFDADGRLDIIAGNWGLNSPYQLQPAGPWYLYFADFTGDGRLEILEAYRDPPGDRIRPWRAMTTVEQFLPWIRERYPTHRAYAQADINGLLRNTQSQTGIREISHLASTLFLQRHDGWETRLLPPEAQWSPVRGIVVADFDADGCEDLFLSQNFHASRPEDPRMDTGRGLLLRGDGSGGFQPIAGLESGIVIYGEQSSCATADYNLDGRTDLVVAQPRGPLRLFQNSGTPPGLRVRLEGSASNPLAIGARLRLVYASGPAGPVREVQAGGGTWSQNGAVQVLGSAETATALQVYWPGTGPARYELPEGTAEVVVRPEGTAETF